MAERVVFAVSEDARVRQAVAGAQRRELGAHVLPMRGGDAVLAWAGVLRPFAVVVDLAGPTGDGVALARRLATHPDPRGVAVVVLTSGDPEGRDRALAAGCAGAVVVPTEPGAVARAVTLCTRASAAGTARVSA